MTTTIPALIFMFFILLIALSLHSKPIAYAVSPRPTPEPGFLKVISHLDVSHCPLVDPGCGPEDPHRVIVIVKGHSPTPSRFHGSADGVEVSLLPGSYSVNGYLPGAGPDHSGVSQASAGCSGKILTGQTKTCQMTVAVY
jgi:hypothetical protein